jgi:hypothetical protein
MHLWQYGKKFFLPFIFYSIIFYGIAGIISFFIYFLYTTILGDPIADYHSEKPFFYSLIFVILQLIYILGLLWTWSVRTRVEYIHGEKFFVSMKLGLKKILKNLKKVLIILFIGFIFFIISFYWMEKLHETHGSSSWWIMSVLFIGMQIINLMRIIMRTIMELEIVDFESELR